MLVERGRHPRFAIGESSTPLANLLIEELADRYDLPRIRPFSKWGTWQRARPRRRLRPEARLHVLLSSPAQRFEDDRRSRAAADGGGEPARRDRRHPLVSAGVRSRAGAGGAGRGRRVPRHDAARATCATRAIARSSKANAKAGPFASPRDSSIDASGPRGFLHHALGLEEGPRRWLPPTQGLFTHFEGVERWDSPRPDAGRAAVSTRRCGAAPGVSGRMDLDAAVQQRPDQRRRRVDRSARCGDRRAPKGPPAWDRLLETLPSVAEQFRDARATMPFVHSPRAGVPERAGRRPTWALLPSAAGVIDPLLSTGFPLTLLGILRLVDLLEHTVPGPEREAALAALRADHARRARCHRAAGRRALRDDGRSRAVQAPEPAVLRGGELQRDRAAARTSAARARLPAARASRVRPGAAACASLALRLRRGSRSA